MARSTITSKGQTTIPKLVRERLGVNYGDQIDFVIRPDGTVVVEAAHVDVMSLAGILKKKGQKPRTVEDMNEAIRAGAAGKR